MPTGQPRRPGAYLYVAHATRCGRLHKIGVSHTPSERVKHLDSGARCGMRLVFSRQFPSRREALDVEGALKRRLAYWQIRLPFFVESNTEFFFVSLPTLLKHLKGITL